jgi:hypothetical protein
MHETVKNPSQSLELGGLLKEQEVAQMLSVSLACLRKWRAQGRGPAFKRLAGGPAIRYAMSSLSEWIESQPGGGSDLEGKDERRVA